MQKDKLSISFYIAIPEETPTSFNSKVFISTDFMKKSLNVEVGTGTNT